MRFGYISWLFGLLAIAVAKPECTTLGDCCSSSRISDLILPNGRVLGVSASTVIEYHSQDTTISFCNVTVTYTHPGWNDTIHTTVWLPQPADWNGRLQGTGGGGYAATMGDPYQVPAVAGGYVAVATDSGHAPVDDVTWVLDSAQGLNWALIEDFASVSLNDAAVLGKQVTNRFYGQDPHHSYWNGCSTGGRQGLMLAQRYPNAYDGIVAAAPAINMPMFSVAGYWPQFVMNQLQHYPPPCVFDAITTAAVDSCDGMDGVQDGIISAPELCLFNPHDLVDREVDCNGVPVIITEKDALIVKKAWEGPRTADGLHLWHGLNPGTPLSKDPISTLASTSCTTTTNCTGNPNPTVTGWIKHFVLQKPSFDLTSLDFQQYVELFQHSTTKFDHVIGTNDPDLSAFKDAGGKMITWHGLTDEVIFPGGTEDYYNEVEALDPSLRDFYLYFGAPGVGHCYGGSGAAPVDPLAAVVSWVENGTAPYFLEAVAQDAARDKHLCPYPLVSVYNGGDPNKAYSYDCEASF